MKEYLFLFRGGPQFKPASPQELQQAISPKGRAWMEALGQKGQLVKGQRLVSGTGAVIKGTKKQLVQGPYAEKDAIGGYLIIKANSLDEAIETAKGGPILEFDNGVIEVREIASN